MWSYLLTLLSKCHPEKKNYNKWELDSNNALSNSRQSLGLESNCQPKPGIFVQGLGVKLTGNCQHWLWYDLMLHQCPKFPMIVELGFHHCQVINSKWPSNSKSILIRRKPSCDLPNSSTLFQQIQMMHIRCSNRISLVTSVRKKANKN